MSEILQLYYSNLRVPYQLKCVLCRLVLKNAKQTTCGCRVCEKCIIDYLSTGQKSCPGNEPDCSKMITMDDIYEDNATNREIGNLPVKCPHKSCSFTNVLKNIESHIKNCEFQEMDCEKCNERIFLNMKKKHDEKLCKMRNVRCKYCNKEDTIKDFNIKHLNCDINKSSFCYTYLMNLPLQFLEADFLNIPNRLRCVICHLILINAKQTSCGCRVCEICIKRYLLSGLKSCPGKELGCTDQLTINDIDPDYATNREIRHLIVKCPFNSCSFEGFLMDIDDHIYKCEFRYIKCDKCNQMVVIDMKEYHDSILCKVQKFSIIQTHSNR